MSIEEIPSQSITMMAASPVVMPLSSGKSTPDAGSTKSNGV